MAMLIIRGGNTIAIIKNVLGIVSEKVTCGMAGKMMQTIKYNTELRWKESI